MKTDAVTSLDRLHDLVIPPSIPWWPLALGWYLILALLGLLMGWLIWRNWKNWRASAYRREALRQLSKLQDAPAIAELLRCTALAIVPRSEIAAKTGSAWADWLDSKCSGDMPLEVHQLLSVDVYNRAGKGQDVSQLHGYAARWISQHRVGNPPTKDIPGE